jgi:hypothetical protein
MAYKGSTILAKKEPAAATSWWEDGYDRGTAGDNLKGDGGVGGKFFSGFEADGSDFAIQSIKTDLHQLDGIFMNTQPSSFLLLNEPGKGNFQKNSSVTIYSLSKTGMEKERSFLVGDHSGFFSLSPDDAILAVGVLKEDTVQVYQVDTGELLINLKGGQKLGFFGELNFLPDALNNTLMECRVSEMQKGRPTQCVMRMWDLGFRPRREPTESDSDSDADEEENKLWEKKLAGEINYAPCESSIVTTRTANNTVEWLDMARGKAQRAVKTGQKWSSKSVASSNRAHVAVSHFGMCQVYEVSSGNVVAEIISPDETSEMYPLTPVTFFGKENEWLLLRINQERILTLCNWRNSVVDMISISGVGGTISDNSLMMSPDEKFLVSWPFGYLEMYDFTSMKELLFRSVSARLRWECVRVRNLLLQERATAVASGSPEKQRRSLFFKKMLGVLLYDAFRQVVDFL